jgi:uncharacterized protein (DUF885 family)
VLAASLLVVGTHATRAQVQSIDAFFGEFTDTWVRMSPSQATSFRYFTGDEQRRFERQLTPETRAWKVQRIALAKKGLEALTQFDRRTLTAPQRLSADLMRSQLETVVAEEPFLDFTFPLEQMNGANVSLVEFLTVRHPVAAARDADNYVAALGEVAARMDEAVAEHRAIGAKGIVPPRFILATTIAQMEGFSSPAPADNPFVTVLAQKMDAIQGLAAADTATLRGQAEAIVRDQVYPAWRRAIALLQTQVPRATDDAGLWRLPNGPRAYRQFLKRHTTTDLTPEQIHDVGLKEVARLEREMEAVLRKLGRNTGTLVERIAQLRKDQAYPLTDDGRTTIMAEVESILRDAEKRSVALFDRTPKSPVVAQPFPRFREANAAANYNAPAPDGSRPGTFQIPLRPERMTKFGLRTLVYHETVPGHHFQSATQVENKTLPRFRQTNPFFNVAAFGEGWGLYAERLAVESGWYEGDLEGQLGQMEAALFRARRLVVDTGLHAKRWTRQQAIDYGIEASEVDRYVVFPGQACSYMIGQLKLVELREKARAALGARFSIRAYHDFVLQTGRLPLDLLEREVNGFIARGGTP